MLKEAAALRRLSMRFAGHGAEICAAMTLPLCKHTLYEIKKHPGLGGYQPGSH